MNRTKLTALLALLVLLCLICTSNLLAVSGDAHNMLSENGVTFDDYNGTKDVGIYVHQATGMHFTTVSGSEYIGNLSMVNQAPEGAEKPDYALNIKSLSYVNTSKNNSTSDGDKYGNNKDIVDLFFSNKGPARFTFSFEMTIDGDIPATQQSSDEGYSPYRGMSLLSIGRYNWLLKGTGTNIKPYTATLNSTSKVYENVTIDNDAVVDPNVGYIYGVDCTVMSTNDDTTPNGFAFSDVNLTTPSVSKTTAKAITGAMPAEMFSADAENVYKYTKGVPFTVTLECRRTNGTTYVTVKIGDITLVVDKTITQNELHKAYAFRFLDGTVNNGGVSFDDFKVTVTACDDNHGGFGTKSTVIDNTDIGQSGFRIEKSCLVCGDVFEVEYVDAATSYIDLAPQVNSNKFPGFSGAVGEDGVLSFDSGIKYIVLPSDKVLDTSTEKYWIKFSVDIDSFDIDGMVKRDGTLSGGRNFFGMFSAYKSSAESTTIKEIKGTGPNVFRMFVVPDGTDADGNAKYKNDEVVIRRANVKNTVAVATLGLGKHNVAVRIAPDTGMADYYIDDKYVTSVYVGKLSALAADSGGGVAIYGIRFLEGTWFNGTVSDFIVVPDGHTHKLEVADLVVGDTTIKATKACYCGYSETEEITNQIVEGTTSFFGSDSAITFAASGEYWITSDIQMKKAYKSGALITLDNTHVLSLNVGSSATLVSGDKDLGITFETFTTYQAAVRVIDKDYELYIDGELKASGTLSTAPTSVKFGSAAHNENIIYNYNKIVKLDETDAPVATTFKAVHSLVPCAHSVNGGSVAAKNKVIISSYPFKYSYVCAACGERAYVTEYDNLLDGTITKGANPNLVDGKEYVKKGDAVYLYSDEKSIGPSASPFWLSFNIRIDYLNSAALMSGRTSGDLLGWNDSGNPYLRLLRMHAIPDATSSTGYKLGAADLYTHSDKSKSAFVTTLYEGVTYQFALYINPATGDFSVYLDGEYVTTQSHGKLGVGKKEYYFRLTDANYGTFVFSDLSFVKEVAHVHSPAYAVDNDGVNVGMTSLETSDYVCYCGAAVNVAKTINSIVVDNLNSVYYGNGTVASLPTSGEYWIATDVHVTEKTNDTAIMSYGDTAVLSIKDNAFVAYDNAKTGVSINAPVTYQVALKVNADKYSLYIDGKYIGEYTATLGDTLTLGAEKLDTVNFKYTKAVTLGNGATVEPKFTDTAIAPDKLCGHIANTDFGVKFYATDTVAVNGKYLKALNNLVYSFVCENCGERVYIEQGDQLNITDSTSTFVTDEQGNATINNASFLLTDLETVNSSVEPYWISFDYSFRMSEKQYDALVARSAPKKSGGSFFALRLPLTQEEYEKLNNPNRDPFDYIQFMRGYALLDENGDYYRDRVGIRLNADTIPENGKIDVFATLKAGEIYNIGVYVEPSECGMTYKLYIDGEFVGSNFISSYLNNYAKNRTDANEDYLDKYPFSFRFLDGGYGKVNIHNLSLVRANTEVTSALVADDNVSVIEFNAKIGPQEEFVTDNKHSLVTVYKELADASKTPLELLYVDMSTAELLVKLAEDDYRKLYSDLEGTQAITISATTPIAVIYDDIKGTVRYYVNNAVPYYNNGAEISAAADIAVFGIEEFKYAVAVKERVDVLEFATGKKTGGYILGWASIDDVVLYNVNDSGVAEIIATQEHSTRDSVRILAGVDTLWYSSIGFDVEVFVDSGDGYVSKGAKKVDTSSNVFSTIVANDREISAKEACGFRYFAILTVDDVELKEGESYYVLVSPISHYGTGDKYGEKVKINVSSEGCAFDSTYEG